MCPLVVPGGPSSKNCCQVIAGTSTRSAIARPLALPLAIRLHALLTRLLEREAVVAQRGAAATNFATSADAELLRISI